MKKKIFIIIILLHGKKIFSQSVDSLDLYYLEDQLYIGFSYNVILNKNSINGIPIRNGTFSNGFSLGFIRDIPINERRNIGIGLGLGFRQDNIYTNLKIFQDDSGNILPTVMETENYTSNKITLNKLEIPLEFRWRTSTPKEDNFYRLYAGFIFSYVFSYYNAYQDENIDLRYYNNGTANNFQYGISFLFGYGYLNFFGLYNLSPIFSSGFKINESKINISNLNLGLRYFIL